MNNTILSALIILGFLGLVISLEWENLSKIKAMDPKKIATILIILFFLGTALTALFRY